MAEKDPKQKQLRKRLGEKKVKEIVDHAEALKKGGKGPDEIADAVKARFPEIGAGVSKEDLIAGIRMWST